MASGIVPLAVEVPPDSFGTVDFDGNRTDMPDIGPGNGDRFVFFDRNDGVLRLRPLRNILVGYGVCSGGNIGKYMTAPKGSLPVKSPFGSLRTIDFHRNSPHVTDIFRTHNSRLIFCNGNRCVRRPGPLRDVSERNGVLPGGHVLRRLAAVVGLPVKAPLRFLRAADCHRNGPHVPDVFPLQRGCPVLFHGDLGVGGFGPFRDV